MQVFYTLCGLFLAIAIANCSTIVKRETEEDLNPLNEIYVIEADKDEAVDGERGDRDKRKIGLAVGIKNGILNFVFGKIDGFLESKTRALDVLDESNKAKNAAFGIDPHQSATSQFLSNLVSQKIQSATAGIGPLINSATTLFAGSSTGLTNALTSKIAPLSSLSGSLSGGAGGEADAAGGSGSAFIGNILTQAIGSLSSVSQSSGGLGGLSSLSGSSNGNGDTSTESADVSAGAGINLGAFANLGGRTTRTTTEDTPIFDRNKVSLDIPSGTFATAFNLLTNVTKVLNSVILNSARRTQTLAEIFKPFFRGTFAIKGLPSDNSIEQ